MPGYVTNIERETLENRNFRKVLFTGKHHQLVVMSLKPGEDIGEEVHDVDQFIRVEQGRGVVEMAKKCQDPAKDIWGFGQTLNRSDDGNGFMNNILLDYGGGVWDKDGKPALGTSFLKQNLTAGEMQAITVQTGELAAIMKSFGEAKEGSVVTLDFIDNATNIGLDGTARGTVDGAAFNDALTRIWIGEHPAQADLKKAMLGGA